MSERLKMLSNKSLDEIVPHTWTKLSYDEFQALQSHYGKLIIGECIKLCLEASHRDDDMGSLLAKRINTHFELV